MTNIDSIGGQSATLKKTNHFIEFQIKDTENGNPVAGATVFVRFGTGEIHSQKSGSSGRVQIRYIPEGPCDLIKCVKGHALLEEKEHYTLEESQGRPTALSFQGVWREKGLPSTRFMRSR